MKHKTRNALILGVMALIVLAAVGSAALLSRPAGNELYASVAIEATAYTEQGVDPDTAFTLTTGYRTDEETLRAMLSVEPEVGGLSISGAGKAWSVKTENPLEQNTVYTFTVKNLETKEVVQSFAFQTKSDLLVNSVFPRDKATYVNVDSGIELVFNATGVQPEGSFEIKPPVAGTFRVNGYTATFIPAAPLASDSIYRVTVKAGLSAPNGTTLREDYSFSFETTSPEKDKWDYTRLRLAGDFAETFLPGDPLVVELSSGSNLDGVKFDVKVNQFPDIETYQKTLRDRDAYYRERFGARSDYVVNTDGLQEVAAYNGELLSKTDDDWSNRYAILPDTLEEGHYIVTVSGEDADGNGQFVQKLLQIRNLSVYTQSANGETLAWLNDPASGGALAGMPLILTDLQGDRQIEATTQGDGTALMMTSGMESAELQVLRDGKPVYVETLDLSKEEDQPLNQRFYTALYTDREIYQPDDTIRFWGVVKARNAVSATPETVHAALSSGWPESDITKVKLAVAADGTFSGEIPVSGLRQEWYSLRILDGEGEAYTSKGFTITEYVKPAYLIDIKTDKEIYEYNEQIRFTISAKFFDGTPYVGGRLMLNCYSMSFGASGNSVEVALDASGTATVTGMMDTSVDRDRNGMYGWQPRTVYYYVDNSQSQEDVYISSSGTFFALPSKAAGRVAYDEKAKTVTVETAWLDASKVDSKEPQPRPAGIQSDFDRLKGAAADLPVSVRVHKVAFVKTPVSSYYDYVNKRTVTRYRTNREESVVKVLSGQTSGGKAVFEDIDYQTEEDAYYWFEAQFPGGLVGDVVCGNEGDSFFYYGESNSTRYTFVDPEEQPKPVALDGEIDFALYQNGRKIQNEGSVLCTALQDRVVNTGVLHDSSWKVAMTEDFLPNVRFVGAYFDGRHVYKINSYNVRYDYEERMLDVKTQLDKPSYRPGETAKVTLTVADRATGKPVAASAVIGVVDESVFALSEQRVDLAAELYQDVYYPYIARSVSYNKYDLEDANAATGGKGGGGGDGAQLREEFVDTAAFQTVAVDESGSATVEIPLPDNVTSWRVTALAVTPELKAGDTVSNTAATLPFYLRPLFTDRYLAGDDVSIAVGAVGTAVAPDDMVEYTVTISDRNGAELDRMTASGKAGDRTPLNFGKYDAGNYLVKVEGSCKGNADSEQHPFSVVEKAMTVSRIDTMPLDRLNTMESVSYPVRLQIYDDRMSAFMDGLRRLSAQDGDRTEILAASYRARVLYNELLPEEERVHVRRDARLDQIQDVYGEDCGVRPLPLAGGDAALTAKMLVAAPELINTGAAKEFLQSVLADASATPDDRVMAYMGLAAVKAPVLLDITRLSREEGLTVAQRLYLGSGLACLGDFTSAENIYAQVKESGALQSETNLKFVAGATNDERLANTAAALMLTSITHNPDAEALMRYLTMQDNVRSVSMTTLTNLEMLTYLEKFTLPADGKAGRFSYQLDGQLREEVLDGRGFRSLSLDEKGFRDANFRVLSGDVYAAADHMVYAEELSAPPSAKLTIEKTYTPSGGEFKTGGQVRVDLTVTFSDDAPSGCYNLVDYIPSGMRVLPTTYDMPYYDWTWASMANEGQTMRGTLYRDNSKRPGAEGAGQVEPVLEQPGMKVNPGTDGETAEDPNVYHFTYYVNCALPGEFVASPAYVLERQAGLAAKSESGAVRIS